jgi:hypothetical protein
MKLETAQTAPPAAAKLETPSRPCFIKRLDEISIEDVPSVGGKTASLGEMFRELSPQGVKVPDGFAITAEAYRSFLSTGARSITFCAGSTHETSRRCATVEQKFAKRFWLRPSPLRFGMKFWPPTSGCVPAATRTWASRSGAARQRRTCPTPVLPDNRKRI